MDDYDNPQSDKRNKKDFIRPVYQQRRRPDEAEDEKRRWPVPLAIVLFIIIGIGALGFFISRSEIGMFQSLKGLFSPAEEVVQIEIPLALFAGQDLDQVTSAAIDDYGVDEIIPVEGDILVYNMSPDVHEQLVEKSRQNIEDKLAALEDSSQYPAVVDISYDSSYKDFYFAADEGQHQPAIKAAAELYVLAVYHQYLITAEGDVEEIFILVEEVNGEGDREMLVYPGDLERAAAILESPDEPVTTPRGPAAGDKVIVDTGPDNLNLRDGPDITYLITDILSSGTVLEVIGVEGVWLEVITPDQKEGWVHGDFVEPYSEEEE